MQTRLSFGGRLSSWGSRKGPEPCATVRDVPTTASPTRSAVDLEATLIRMPPTMLADARELAKAEGLSLAGLFRALLAGALGTPAPDVRWGGPR